MNSKTCIIVDSCSNIKNNQIDNVFSAPLIITENEDGKEIIYQDLFEIDTISVIKKIIANKDLKTAQTPFGEMLTLLEKLLINYNQIIILPISSALSGSFASWNIAKEEFKDKQIEVIDTKDMGAGIQLIVNLVLNLIKQNKTINQIKQEIELFKQNKFGTLVVTDLTQLKKGGRITTFKAMIAKTLKYNIIINFDGGLNFFDKSRSIQKTIKMCCDQIDKQLNYSKKGIEYALFYSSFLDENINKDLKNQVDKLLGFKTSFHYFPAIITVHTGHNTFGIYVKTM